MTARRHRDAAKAAAPGYVAVCCPWATAWRIGTARPISGLRKHFHAMIAVRRPDGTEHLPIYINDALTEADALDRLTLAMQAAKNRGVPAPERPAPRFIWYCQINEHSADHNDLAALGLARPPTPDELATAWRETAKRTHPDAGGSEAAFIAARAAYERLRAVTA